MRNNVTSHYQISNNETLDRINTSAKSITDNLGISDRVEPIAPKNSYITIKDHKPDYPNNIKCRLINPAKSNIGKISKQILTKINETIRQKLGLQQWRSTTDTLNWFKNLKQKHKLKFLVLDIVDFYPSINEKLFETTLNFANTITPISDEARPYSAMPENPFSSTTETSGLKTLDCSTSLWDHMTAVKYVNWWAYS